MFLEPTYDLDRRANLNRLAGRRCSCALNAAQYFERYTIARPFAAMSGAVAAALADQLDQRIADALPRDLHQPEFRHRRNLCWRMVLRKTLRQRIQHSLDVRGIGKMYEVDDDQTTYAAKSNLPSNLLGGFQIDAQARLLEPCRCREAARIDVHGGKCLRTLDRDPAT